jgi:hypothetical protein
MFDDALPLIQVSRFLSPRSEDTRLQLLSFLAFYFGSTIE